MLCVRVSLAGIRASARLKGKRDRNGPLWSRILSDGAGGSPSMIRQSLGVASLHVFGKGFFLALADTPRIESFEHFSIHQILLNYINQGSLVRPVQSWMVCFARYTTALRSGC